jgi:hypothetical protein
MVRPDEDAFFLQVKVLSGQALEHPVADHSRKERSNRELPDFPLKVAALA